jgi:hypothetical protein
MDKTINILPEEVKNIIWDFIPIRNKIIINKYYFEKYHYLLENNAKTPFKIYITYIRKILRSDQNYIFSILLKNNYEKWKKMKQNKIIKQLQANNFIDCLNLLCIEYNASKCRKELFSYTKET